MKVLHLLLLVGLVAAKGGGRGGSRGGGGSTPSKSQAAPPPPPSKTPPSPPPPSSTLQSPPKPSSSNIVPSSSALQVSNSPTGLSSTLVSVTTSRPASVSSGSISTLVSSPTGSLTKSLSTSTPSSSTSSVNPSATAPTQPYIVYPEKSTDKKQTDAIKKLLTSYVYPKNRKQIEESGVPGIIINYWKVPLNATAAEKLAKDPKIGSITVDTTTCKKDKKGKCFNPTTAITIQKDAPDDLVYFSQREDTLVGQYGKQFHYEEEAGEGVTCYILDDGFDLDKGGKRKEEFANLDARWLPATTTDKDSDGKHGTCMLSRMSGTKNGVGKKCSVVLIKAPAAGGRAKWLDGLSLIVGDVTAKKPKKAVLSLSLYWPLEQIQVDVVSETATTGPGSSNQKPPKGGQPAPKPGSLDEPETKKEVDENWIQKFYDNLKILDEHNVVLVAASGNDAVGNVASKQVMDGYPAGYGSATEPKGRYLKNMIVVGATNAQSGYMWHKSNFDNKKGLPHVFAPGENVPCEKDGPSNTDGTSPATASVAGLVAYFMSLPGGPTTPQAVKQKILSTSWISDVRHPAGFIEQPSTGIRRVWNEVTVDFAGIDCPPDYPPRRPAGQQQQDDDDANVGKCCGVGCVIAKM